MAHEPSDTILVAIRITLRIRESKVRNPDPPDRWRFVLSEHSFLVVLYCTDWLRRIASRQFRSTRWKFLPRNRRSLALPRSRHSSRDRTLKRNPSSVRFLRCTRDLPHRPSCSERIVVVVSDHLSDCLSVCLLQVGVIQWNIRCYSNTIVYYGMHKRSESIPVDSGVTNLIHDRRSCVDFTLEVRWMWLDVSTQVWSNKPGVKRNSGLWDVYPLQTLLWR